MKGINGVIPIYQNPEAQRRGCGLRPLRRISHPAATGTFVGAQSGCGTWSGQESWNLEPAVAAGVTVIAGARLVVPLNE